MYFTRSFFVISNLASYKKKYFVNINVKLIID